MQNSEGKFAYQKKAKHQNCNDHVAGDKKNLWNWIASLEMSHFKCGFK